MNLHFKFKYQSKSTKKGENPSAGGLWANMSIGNSLGGAPYLAIRSAVRRMVNVGIVVVAAAGNDAGDMAGPDGVFGDGDDKVPAAYAEAMAVSAMDPTTDTIAPFSNFSQIVRTNLVGLPSNFVISSGLTIDVAAPGGEYLNDRSWQQLCHCQWH